MRLAGELVEGGVGRPSHEVDLPIIDPNGGFDRQ